MPIYFHKDIQPQGELGLWQIEESEEWFLNGLDLVPTEQEQLAQIKGQRRTEWLAVRQLVHQMSGRTRRGAFIKDEHGKPHLENSEWYISISHSRAFAAAIAAPMSVGIDIQLLVSKIERIAHKFVRPEEEAALQETTRLLQLHAYWGAKEALYKAYGRRQLDFCQHIIVEPFTYEGDQGTFSGRVEKDDFLAHYQIEYQLLNDYMLVFAHELQAV